MADIATPIDRETVDAAIASGDQLTCSADELAAVLGVGRASIYRSIARGDIPAIKVGRLRRIPLVSVHAILAEATS